LGVGNGSERGYVSFGQGQKAATERGTSSRLVDGTGRHNVTRARRVATKAQRLVKGKKESPIRGERA